MEFEQGYILNQNEATALTNSSLEEDCCQMSDGNKQHLSDPNNVCFSTYTMVSKKDHFSSCMPARKSLINSTSYCHLPSIQERTPSAMSPELCPRKSNPNGEPNSAYCMIPVFGVGSSETLLQVKRERHKANKDDGTDNIVKDFLFIGNPAQVYNDVIVSNYIPR